MDLATVDKLLTTTRTVRKRLDLEKPVPREVIEACLRIAIQAPTGSNAQGWHFLVVTDAEKRTQIAEWYRDSFYQYARSRSEQPRRRGEGEAHQAQLQRVVSSARHLADNLQHVPVLIFCCIEGRVEEAGQMAQAGLYGSILPAAWSLMLALRARGLGAAWTTLHLRYAEETAALLNIPDHVTQTVMLPVAYFKGEDFKPAKRIPAERVTSWETWGESA